MDKSYLLPVETPGASQGGPYPAAEPELHGEEGPYGDGMCLLPYS